CKSNGDNSLARDKNHAVQRLLVSNKCFNLTYEQGMTPSPSESETLKTKQRLLEVAGAVFAEQGFKNATVREICKRADANVAAINYHFGDKQGLYSETLRYWVRE